MAWCPICGAEYRPGMECCTKCAVALADERPRIASPGLPQRLPAPIRRAADQVAAALGYAAGALRLLRRHPSLLLLPIAVAVFDAVESGVGQHLLLGHTAYGRQIAQQAELWREERRRQPPADVLRAVREAFSVRSGARIVAAPVGGPSFSGTRRLCLGLATGSRSQAGARWFPWYSWASLLVGLGLAIPVAAAVGAGYYGVACGVVMGRGPRWREFGGHFRRCFARFLVYSLAVSALFTGIALLLQWRSGTSSGSFWPDLGPRPLDAWIFWIMPVLRVLLALTQISIVTDNASVLVAAKRSVRTVARGALVALALVAIVTLVRGVALTPVELLGATAASSPLRTASPAEIVLGGAIQGTQETLAAAIGVWLLLALLLWYRAAGPGPGMQADDGLQPLPIGARPVDQPDSLVAAADEPTGDEE